jgi:hypothetical protein
MHYTPFYRYFAKRPVKVLKDKIVARAMEFDTYIE